MCFSCFWSVLLFKQKHFSRKIFLSWNEREQLVTHGVLSTDVCVCFKKNQCSCFYKCMNVTGVQAHMCFSELLLVKELMEAISFQNNNRASTAIRCNSHLQKWNRNLATWHGPTRGWYACGLLRYVREKHFLSSLWRSVFQKIFILTPVLIALQYQN